MDNSGDGVTVLLVLLAFYFVPSILAFARGHHQRFAVLMLNILLGWTFLFWVFALVWACTAGRERPAPPAPSETHA